MDAEFQRVQSKKRRSEKAGAAVQKLARIRVRIET